MKVSHDSYFLQWNIVWKVTFRNEHRHALSCARVGSPLPLPLPQLVEQDKTQNDGGFFVGQAAPVSLGARLHRGIVVVVIASPPATAAAARLVVIASPPATAAAAASAAAARLVVPIAVLIPHPGAGWPAPVVHIAAAVVVKAATGTPAAV